MHDDNIKEVSPVFSHHVSHSSITAHRKVKTDYDRAVYPWLVSEWPETANTYTNPKGLLVIRKSFFPWLTSWCKTASVSSPLRMNLSMRRRWTPCYFTWSNVLTWHKKRRSFSPRSSITHLYMYPLRWTMPIASWGLNRFNRSVVHVFHGTFSDLTQVFSQRKTPNYKNI